jgi:prepilin peptidase CpaA
MDMLAMLLLAPVMVAVAYFDLRFMRIPNGLVLLALIVFAAAVVMAPPADLLARLAIAAAVFAIGVVGFAFRMVGGGDVKMLPVLLLAVPSAQILLFANVFSAALILGIVAVLTLRRIPATAHWGWKSFGGSRKFPMGLSIAMAGLAFPVVSLTLHGG